MHDTADVEAIRNVLEKYVTCCRSGDFDAWIFLWAERVIQIPPDVPARVGKAEIKSAMEPAFEEMTLDLDILGIGREPPVLSR